jgi:hypothetical protein
MSRKHVDEILSEKGNKKTILFMNNINKNFLTNETYFWPFGMLFGKHKLSYQEIWVENRLCLKLGRSFFFGKIVSITTRFFSELTLH